MKYVVLLAAIGGIYFYFAHQSPVKEVAVVATGTEVVPLTQPAPAAEPARTNALKRPIDRTKEVLGQVARRNDAE